VGFEWALVQFLPNSSSTYQEAEMRSRRNLLLIVLVVILIFALIYFVQRRGNNEIATVVETTTTEVQEAASDVATEVESETADTATTEETTSEETAVGNNAAAESAETVAPTDNATAIETTAATPEVKEGTADTTTTAETAETETATPINIAETGSTITYIVRPGDNLFLIGLPYGLQWTEIAAINNLTDPNDLEVGQEILIPAAAPMTPIQPPAPIPATPRTHMVQVGENLFRIALSYNMDWMYLAQANHIGAPYMIYAGQTLMIPGK
jgi:lysozyme